jgi:hypothetical protein
MVGYLGQRRHRFLAAFGRDLQYGDVKLDDVVFFAPSSAMMAASTV